MARLDALPLVQVRAIGAVREARSRRARLLGLAFLPVPPAEPLLLRRCRSVHTLGMRFPVSLLWLDAEDRLVHLERVPPGRVRRCRTARSVVEIGPQPETSER